MNLLQAARLLLVFAHLLLCAFAQALSTRLRGNRTFGRWLERAAGIFLVGFGIRMLRD